MSDVCHSVQKDNPSGLTPENNSIDESSSNSTMKNESNSNSITKDGNVIEIENSQDYEKFITYDENGTAIYTDPSSNQQFVFDREKGQWISKSDNGEFSTGTNIYENEHYRWCAQTQRWILKNAVENDYYNWNAEKNEWEPKTQCTNTSSILKDDQKDSDYFWDEEKKAWFPKIDDDFIAIYQTNYGFVDNTSEKSTEKPVLTTEEAANINKSQADSNNENNKSSSTKRKANQPQWFDESPENCTKVYVSNLPEGITEEEFVEVMSKCGMILRDTKTKKFKVKLYAEPNGQLKGDGLVHYIRSESVKLAIDLLDGYDLRGKKIKVQRAQFQMRGDYNPALKPKKNKKDKEKEKKFKEKALDWRPDRLLGERNKHERVVVLKNLFTPDLFENHMDLIIDYQNNVRQEASKYGTVKKVVIYSSEPEGVAEIVMNDPEEADLAVKMMNGTTFDTRILSAETWDGKTRYRKNETEAEVSERLSKWDEFLEADDTEETQSKS